MLRSLLLLGLAGGPLLASGACHGSPPAPELALELDPRFCSFDGANLVLAGTRGTVEVQTRGLYPERTPGLPLEPRAARLALVACRFYLGDQRGRLHLVGGPGSPIPPPRSVEFQPPVAELEVWTEDGGRLYEVWVEVGFPAFQADGLVIGALAPVRVQGCAPAH